MPGLDSLIQNKVGVGFPAENIHKKKLKLRKNSTMISSKLIRFDLDKFHTFGWVLLNKTKIIVLIFIKLKLILSRKIILIVVKKLKQLGKIFIAWDSFKKVVHTLKKNTLVSFLCS